MKLANTTAFAAASALALASALVLALAFCSACRVPDYYELAPGYGTSSADFTRPVSGFDEETYSLVFTVGWLAGAQAEAMDNLSRLDVSKAGQITMRPETSGDVEVVVEGSEESSLLEVLAKAPTTAEESWGLLAWGFVVLLAAGAFWIYRRAKTPEGEQ